MCHSAHMPANEDPPDVTELAARRDAAGLAYDLANEAAEATYEAYLDASDAHAAAYTAANNA